MKKHILIVSIIMLVFVIASPALSEKPYIPWPEVEANAVEPPGAQYTLSTIEYEEMEYRLVVHLAAAFGWSDMWIISLKLTTPGHTVCIVEFKKESGIPPEVQAAKKIAEFRVLVSDHFTVEAIPDRYHEVIIHALQQLELYLVEGVPAI